MKKILVIYFGLALLFVSGFFAHESDPQEIFIYSYKYFAVIVTMALILLVAVPWWMNRYISKNGVKDFFSAILPSLITILALFFIGKNYYYATQEHLFEPFLQMPPNEYEYSDQKDSTTLRVLCLGGSTTRNVRLDTTERYPTVLHNILKEQIPNKKVELINAGMDWYTTKHTLINYAAYCREFNPDIVIVMHGINDLCRSFSPESLAVGPYKSDYTHFYGPSIAGAKPPSFEKLAKQLFRKFWFTPEFSPADFDIAAFKSLPDFQKYFGQIIDVVQNDGAEVFVVSQPYFYKNEMTEEEKKTLWMDRQICIRDGEFPNSRSMAMAMDAYNAATAKVAYDYQINFIHGEPNLPKDLEHFVDDVHYTAKGAKKLAEVIGDALLDDK